MLKSGTLWASVLSTTEHALGCGTLQPLATDSTFVEQQGIRFFVRILENLKRKDEARQRQRRPRPDGVRANPFLPYDPDLFVADISATHVGLLNKFNVMDHHLLIVTRAFEDQEAPLSLQDFLALWICMQEFEGLAFYNSGTIAGASQRHKHLQYVPLPLAPNGSGIPIEPLLAGAHQGSVAIVPEFAFTHGLISVHISADMPPQQAAATLLASYRTLLRAVGLIRVDEAVPGNRLAPYNLLMTRKWMLLVPRSRECFQSISINGLGFAGTLLVRNAQQLQTLKNQGPLTALHHVAGRDSAQP